jgi:hypothetical protein
MFWPEYYRWLRAVPSNTLENTGTHSDIYGNLLHACRHWLWLLPLAALPACCCQHRYNSSSPEQAPNHKPISRPHRAALKLHENPYHQVTHQATVNITAIDPAPPPPAGRQEGAGLQFVAYTTRTPNFFTHSTDKPSCASSAASAQPTAQHQTVSTSISLGGSGRCIR